MEALASPSASRLQASIHHRFHQYSNELTGPNQRSTTAETQYDWSSVEEELRAWQEEGKKGLQVDLIYHWARNSTGEIPIAGKAAEKKPGTTISGTSRGSTQIPTNT